MKRMKRRHIIAFLAVMFVALVVMSGLPAFAEEMAPQIQNAAVQPDDQGNLVEGVADDTDFEVQPEKDVTAEPDKDSQADALQADKAAAAHADSRAGEKEDVPKADVTAIYLNGQSGDDAKDGTTPENAVKTFEKAKEIATANQSVKTIYVTGTVNIKGEITLEGTNAIVMRSPSFSGWLMALTDGNTATLKNIVIDGNKGNPETKATSSLIRVSSGTLNIEAGTVLQNNQLTNLGNFQATGGAIFADNGGWPHVSKTINMKGGIIRGNIANLGGGICLEGRSTLNMTGGAITGNKTINGTASGQYGFAAGGGVALAQNVLDRDGIMTFNFSSGTISNNTSDELGGGISLGHGAGNNAHAILNMTGGTISRNTAGSSGGGLFVQAGFSKDGRYSDGRGSWSIANVTGGTITDNQMNGKGVGNNAFGGGGIYVNGYAPKFKDFRNGVLNLKNVLVTNNTSALEGAGLAGCPVSSTHIYVTDGGAIFGNHSRKAQDIYILVTDQYGAHSGDPEYAISNTMLGGTPYNWKYNNGKDVPLNKLAGTLNRFRNESLSLHTDLTSDAAAQQQAKVVISGNESATRGGGIGSNGDVNIGTADTIQIKVTKQWENVDKDAIPESVTIELYRKVKGSEEKPVYIGYETIKPDKSGNWQIIFKNLPKADNKGKEYVYSVKEKASDAFDVTITGDQEKGFVITNQPVKKIDIPVAKAWDDADNQDGIRPDRVTIKLLADGKDTGKTLVLSEDNQ